MTSCTTIPEPPDTTQPKIMGSPDAETFPLALPEIEITSFKARLEAEDATIEGELYAAQELTGYSGEGYVTGFRQRELDKLTFTVSVPTSQHYDLTLRAVPEKGKTQVKNAIFVNNKQIEEFILFAPPDIAESFNADDTEADSFILFFVYGIFLSQGTHEISIHEIDGGIEIDWLEVTNSTVTSEISFDKKSGLSNPNATQEAKELMEYLTANYGKHMLTGQFASSADNYELEMLYEVTGQYPAIRFSDVSGFVPGVSPVEVTGKEAEACVNWVKNGGIAGLMWYWSAPSSKRSVYADSTDFSLKKAVTPEKVATMGKSEIDTLRSKKRITAECVAIIKDIDDVAHELKALQEQNIPVLWRPLHEAGGEWFWWGADGAESYQWLWELLYKRLTEYHELNNLIWIWNGQGTNYKVSPDLYDIASIDVHPKENASKDIQIETADTFYWLYKETEGKKLLALSECGVLPDPDLAFRDKAVWSFFGLWFGDYLIDNNGFLNEAYNNADTLRKVYNSDGTINLMKYILANSDD